MKLHRMKLIHFTRENNRAPDDYVVALHDEKYNKIEDFQEDGYTIESQTDIDLPISFPCNCILKREV